jgi:hypothetical protein
VPSSVSTLTQHTFELLGVQLSCRTDDPDFPHEFISVFGGASPSVGDAPRSSFSAEINRHSTESDFGCLSVSGDGLDDPASFLLGFSSPTIPLRRADAEAGVLLWGEDVQPVFRFLSDGRCLFRRVERWHRILAHFLFLRMLRLRSDLLFFHAASMDVGGKGLLLVGPKGTGKTTTALALTARGHGFHGDETAAYDPAAGCLLPFRRPVGIKPGPQPRAIEQALAAGIPRDPEGLVRVDIERLLPAPTRSPIPLRAVVFMEGFVAQPRLARIQPGREEVAMLQPLGSTLVGADVGRRVFEMMRLLGRAACYRLAAGAPDDTAALLEEVLSAS